MAKDVVSREKGGGEKKLLVGLVWNCAAELKLFLTALLLLCSLATVLQFLPPRFSLSPDIRLCLSPSATVKVATATTTTSNVPPIITNSTTTTTSLPIPSTTTDLSSSSSTSSSNSNTSPQHPPPSPPLHKPSDPQTLPSGIIKRNFLPVGTAAYNFILMSAYRGGPNTFAITGLSSKPLHIYNHPTYQCEYLPHNTSISSTVTGTRILPDWGYGRVYTVIVINCTFPSPIGLTTGGSLLLHTTTNGGHDLNLNLTDSIITLTETPTSILKFPSSPPKYDFLYCGSSLYGSLSPQRVREWIAYHIRLFGKRSHFVIHDAGGVHREVMEILKPWMELGYVTVQDIREQERFDGYYHNQFLIVNDCLHRYRFDTKWMFFFDVDEYVYVVGKKDTLMNVMESFKEFSQITFEQMPMSSKLCLTDDAGKINKKWGMEKLVYRDVKRGIRRDRKYAIQPTQVFATGVHMSQNLQGKTNHRTDRKIKYYHYHGTIAERNEPCRIMMNSTQTSLEGTPFLLDTTLRSVAPFVKRFEQRMIGHRLQNTRQ